MCLAPLSSILVYFGKISDILPFYQFIFFTSILLGLLKISIFSLLVVEYI